MVDRRITFVAARGLSLHTIQLIGGEGWSMNAHDVMLAIDFGVDRFYLVVDDARVDVKVLDSIAGRHLATTMGSTHMDPLIELAKACALGCE